MRPAHFSRPRQAGPIGTLACAIVAGWMACAMPPAAAQTDLNDTPLFSTIAIPGNVLLALSVEFPTAISRAHIPAYNTTTAFIGYFDPKKCYTYHRDTVVSANNYFEPTGATDSSYGCNGAWSGNFLNWATMPTIDPFRWALTGGYRSIDVANSVAVGDNSVTVLEKAYSSQQGGSANFPVQTITDSALIKGATPTNWSKISVHMLGRGVSMRFSGTGDVTANVVGSDGSQSNLDSNSLYDLDVRVRVCNRSVGLEANCTAYGTSPITYKPTGLIQANAEKLRFAAFGYLNDSDPKRDGGVLRARMKSVGPILPVPGSASIVNTRTEWDVDTGVFNQNPDSADASASSVSKSGVISYLNQFGQASHSYKTYDPVSELYYAAIRYLKNFGFVPAYGDASVSSAFKDGFPVITKAEDPIQYACQKNFIIGIGDTNSNVDANVPGSTIAGASEPSMPTEVSADTSVDARVTTNAVGVLEGLGSNLGEIYLPWWWNKSTFLMAGLAYDSHIKDMRPNDFKTNNLDSNGKKKYISTVTTYWVDVIEFSAFQKKNQFWLTAKYGGFDVPSNYSSSNTTPLPTVLWNKNGDKDPAGDLKPDNFYDGGQPDKMVSALASAFSSIASKTAASSALSLVTLAADTSTANANYSAEYDSATWSGNVTASLLTFATDGSVSQTTKWEEKSLLTAQASGNGWSTHRFIATSNSPGTGQGVPFTAAGVTNPAYITALNGAAKYANVINFLRGDQSNEGNAGTREFRTRATVLGDIVNAKPVAVGKPAATYVDDYNPGYASFKTTWQGRATAVYVGANDGMLHAFNGALTGSSAGKELFGYVPSFLFDGPTGTPAINGLASLAVTADKFSHHFMVDASPVVVDVDVGKTRGSTGSVNWKSLLVGGLGKGGKGYYALDVSNPGAVASDSDIAARVLWEFTDPRMGYSYGAAHVVKTKKYGWVVVLTSGYGNADGKGYFFIVDPATGTLLEAPISTNTGSSSAPSGLAHATAYILDYTDYTADAVYAGDLLGNVWRLDLTTTSGNYSVTRIAALSDASGVGQPVTTKPLVEIDSASQKRYVLIGTGRLLADSDIKSAQTQTFYAIVDGTRSAFDTAATLAIPAWPITRANLVNNSNLATGIGANPSRPMGWYFDLASGAGNISERVTSQPTAASGFVAFAANLPLFVDPCSPSGSHRTFAVSITTGKTVLVTTTGTVTTTLSGNGLNTDLSLVNVNGTLRLYEGNDDKSIAGGSSMLGDLNTFRRLNWRDIPSTD